MERKGSRKLRYELARNRSVWRGDTLKSCGIQHIQIEERIADLNAVGEDFLSHIEPSTLPFYEEEFGILDTVLKTSGSQFEPDREITSSKTETIKIDITQNGKKEEDKFQF